MKIAGRPLVVAYHNRRLILMETFADCTEVRTRAEYCGRVWKYSALVYERSGVWYALVSSELENNVPTERKTFEAEAFLTAQNAFKWAIGFISTAQGTQGR